MHIKQDIILPDIQATNRLAEAIARATSRGDTIALHGTLGVGKTTFSQYFVRYLTDENTDVTSPTFTLVHPYDTEQGTLYHLDLYRLESAEELLALGIEEWIDHDILLVEWPELLLECLKPKQLLTVTLAYGQDEHERMATMWATEKKIAAINDHYRTIRD